MPEDASTLSSFITYRDSHSKLRRRYTIAGDANLRSPPIPETTHSSLGDEDESDTGSRQNHWGSPIRPPQTTHTISLNLQRILSGPIVHSSELLAATNRLANERKLSFSSRAAIMTAQRSSSYRRNQTQSPRGAQSAKFLGSIQPFTSSGNLRRTSLLTRCLNSNRTRIPSDAADPGRRQVTDFERDPSYLIETEQYSAPAPHESRDSGISGCSVARQSPLPPSHVVDAYTQTHENEWVRPNRWRQHPGRQWVDLRDGEFSDDKSDGGDDCRTTSSEGHEQLDDLSCECQTDKKPRTKRHYTNHIANHIESILLLCGADEGTDMNLIGKHAARTLWAATQGHRTDFFFERLIPYGKGSELPKGIYTNAFGPPTRDPTESEAEIPFVTKLAHGMTTIRDIAFTSTCDRHLMPFFGTVSVCYVPNEYSMGQSKLMRIVRSLSKMLHGGEGLAADIAETVSTLIQPVGVMVLVNAKHSCLMAQDGHGNTSCSSVCARGLFESDWGAYQVARAELRGH